MKDRKDKDMKTECLTADQTIGCLTIGAAIKDLLDASVKHNTLISGRMQREISDEFDRLADRLSSLFAPYANAAKEEIIDWAGAGGTVLVLPTRLWVKVYK